MPRSPPAPQSFCAGHATWEIFRTGGRLPSNVDCVDPASGGGSLLEILVLGIVALAALTPLFFGRTAFGRPTAVALFLLIVGTAALVASRNGANQAQRRFLERKTPVVAHEDNYVGSGACRACHPSEHQTWHHSYHRTMTTLPSPDTVKGDFSGKSVTIEGRRFVPSREGDRYFIDAVPPSWEWNHREGRRTLIPNHDDSARQKLPVVMITGSHHQQVYWVPGALENQLDYVPLVWLIKDQRWAPMRDIFLSHPGKDEHLRLWNYTCIHCHSTNGVPAPNLETKEYATSVAELGIACEACHGPGGAHVSRHQNPVTRYGQRFSSENDKTIVNPKKLDHVRGSQVCGLCHGIFHTEDMAAWYEGGFRYRPGDDLEALHPLIRPRDPKSADLIARASHGDPDYLVNRFWPDGMVRVSGREHNGLVESPCYQHGTMSCMSCHALHEYEDRNDQLGVGMGGDQACLQCHQDFATRIEAHTHHATASRGSRCVECHMPHTTYGLMKAIRSHEISSPSVKTTVSTGRPNACNQCHVDQTLAWTQGHLAEWYGQAKVPLDERQERISAILLDATTGDAAQRALAAWALGSDSAKEASPDRRFVVPHLAHLLDDPYTTVRYLAGHALDQVGGGASLGYDFLASSAERSAFAAQILERWRAEASTTTARESILLQENGLLDEGTLKALRALRNDRPLDLAE